ncbi:MAG: SPFH domain-containing protein [Oscillospiraceae bacterium]|nr:SPFH domain-containing protein [Oscillospiraceae bacterium]
MIRSVKGISEVIKFDGSPDALVWKFPEEDFNATSQLVVDETHEALLVINGNAADLFGPGRRTLSVPNIPLARNLIEIPTDGKSPFPCKIFFINKVHAMDLRWGTFGPIALEDPLYDIFMHVMANGSMTVSVAESRKFMLKMVGFRDGFSPEEMIQKFRGIISSHVKDCLSKIMINGMLSYFMINANVFELSGVIKERLDEIFDEYGIKIQYFNIETVEVPREDYEAVTKAKERRSGRLIEGYSWQEERQMMIAEKFAGNEGTMGNMGGAVGGFMMGTAMSGSIADIARGALEPSALPSGTPPKNTVGAASPIGSRGAGAVNVNEFFTPKTDADSQSSSGAQPANCPHCNAEIQENAKFCLECGEKIVQVQPQENGVTCSSCGEATPGGKFCLHCGAALAKKCPKCGIEIPANGKFCLECGEKL